ncbi:MAG: hypothetical protein ACYC6J_09200, partial [Coriobacteriia bacterium]
SYSWSKPTNEGDWLTAAWIGRGGANAMMTCTDCHSNTTASAKGPHGSTARWLIDPAYPVSYNRSGGGESNTPQLSNNSPTGMSLARGGTAAAGIICEKCHGVPNLDVVNRVHADHNDRGIEGGYCRHCHVGIPHGWKRPRLIGYTTDPEPYRAWGTSSGPGTGNYGTVQIALKNYTPSGWLESDCSAGCASGRHPNQANPWP